MSKIKFNAIAAMCNENRGIGKNNTLPWSLPNEYSYYLRVVKTTKDKTKINALIMGRLTWLSVPCEERQIEPCLSIIISSKMSPSDIICGDKTDLSKILICSTVDQALKLINEKYSNLVETIYSIGGTQVYKSSMESISFDRFYLTRVLKYFECDTFLKPDNFLSYFKKLETSELEDEQKLYGCEYNKIISDPSGVDYVIEVYEKIKQ